MGITRSLPYTRKSASPIRRKGPHLPPLLVATLCAVASARGQILLQSIPPYPTVGTNQYVEGFCVLGDVDGDAVPDFATGHPYLPGTGGAVRLYAGGTGTLLGERTALSLGATNLGGLGLNLETLGDVTGDGVPEFLAGMFSSGVVPVAGMAFVVSPVSMSLVVTLTGSQPADQFGMGLGGFTDVDGDGVPDPLIGAPTADATGAADAGEAIAFSVFTASPLLMLAGTSVGDVLGARFAAMGDLDGDGKDEFAVDHIVPAWEALVVSGGTGQVLYSITGPGQYTDGFGSIGDLDFDGARELATRSGNGGLQAITVFSWGNPIFTYTVPPTTNLLGLGNFSIESAGDVDGDGFDDIVAGADNSAPPGGGTPGYGAILVISGATGNALEQINGSFPVGAMGRLVGSAGDLNGDGLADVATTNAGRVEIWSLIPAAGVSIDGQACTGTSGMAPAIGITGLPVHGTTVIVNLSRVPVAGSALLLYGPPLNAWNGIPLPLDLAVLGLPGCQLSIPVLDFVPAAVTPRPGPAVGGSGVTIPIPMDPALVGASVAFQWYAPDPGPGPFPGVTTRRLVATIL